MLRLVALVAMATAASGCVPSDGGRRQDDGGSPAAAESTETSRPSAVPRRQVGAARIDSAAGSPERHQRARGDASSTTGAAETRAQAGTPVAAQGPRAPAAPGALIDTVFVDAFDRAELGADWNATSPAWRIKGGRLCAQGARNHGVWLVRRLPVNARIEFDATSSSAHGDIKVEAWGDGKSAAQGVSYDDATSYIAIFGGWRNRFHVLARRDEHASDRLQIAVDRNGGDLRARPVEAERSYHFKIERNDGKTIRWLVDDIELFGFADPDPLRGPGHEHLGFNDWEVALCFDNLVITPLEGE